jgi:hypothetical protein
MMVIFSDLIEKVM